MTWCIFLHKNPLYGLHWIVCWSKNTPKKEKKNTDDGLDNTRIFCIWPFIFSKSLWVGGFNLSQLYEFLIGWFDFVAHRLDQYAHC